MKGRRALVTGGAGFVGAHLVHRLVQEGADVHVLSRGIRRAPESLPLPPSVPVHDVDLSSDEALRPLLRAIGATHVFHLAGRVDLDRSLEVGQACIRDNIGATLTFLNALGGTPVEVLIYSSSTEVYGRNPRPFREDQPVDPPSAYAVSKVAGEHLCRMYAEMHAWRLCVLRLASGYGPGQRTARLIPSAILSCLRGTPLRLRSPEHRRDFMYVADLVEGIVRAAMRPLSPFELINLGSETAVPVVEIVRKITAIAGRAVPVEIDEASRLNEAPCWATNADRARHLLDWTPVTPLDEGLDRTFRWYAQGLMTVQS